VLDYDDLRDELVEEIEAYDFENMSSKSNVDRFKRLLIAWQAFQSFKINACILVYKYKLTHFKKDVEKYLLDDLTTMKVNGLSNLTLNINKLLYDKLLYEYNGYGDLNPGRIKNLIKIEKPILINEQYLKVNKLINDSKAATIYQIKRFSSKYISFNKKREVARIVDK
jgi:hypothetical protein